MHNTLGGHGVAGITSAPGHLHPLVGVPLFPTCSNPSCSSNAAGDLSILLLLCKHVVGFIILTIRFGCLECINRVGVEPVLSCAMVKGGFLEVLVEAPSEVRRIVPDGVEFLAQLDDISIV